MHSNFNDLKTTKMEAKEWFEKSEYQYALDEYDEGGYLGIDENKVAQMLEEYHQDKLKLLGIGYVVGQSEQLRAFDEWFNENWYPEGYSHLAIEAYLKSL
jgi:hypothetical protein